MENAANATDERQHVTVSGDAFDTTEFTSPESQTSQTTDWGVESQEHASPEDKSVVPSPPTRDTPGGLRRSVCGISPTIVPKDLPRESVSACALPDNPRSRDLPVLSRIHILPLGPDATDALKDVIEQRDKQGLFFPDFLRAEGRLMEARARLNAEAVGSSASGASLEEPYPIMRHLSGLLALSPGQKGFPLSLFQAFYVSCNSKVYVVVDMEGIAPQDVGTPTGSTEESSTASRARRVRLGLLSQSTAIFTAGYPIEPLDSVHLSLVRPFKLRTTEPPTHPRSSTFHHDSSANGPTRPSNADSSSVPPVRRLRSLFTRRRVGTTLTTHMGTSQDNPVHSSAHEDSSAATGRAHETEDDPTLALRGVTGASGSQPLSPACLSVTGETQPREEPPALLPTTSSSLPVALNDVPNPPSLSMECNSQNSLGNIGSSFFDGPFFHSSIPPPACPGVSPDTHNTPFDTQSIDPQSGPVVVDLITLVQKELFKNPFIVFVRGREWTLNAAVDLAWESSSVRSSAPSHETEREKSTASELFGIKNPFARVFGRHAKNGAAVRHPPEHLDRGESSKSDNAPLGPILTRFRFFVPFCNGLALGVAIPGRTSICVEPDPVGEFSRIHISPIADTVPVSYEFDFFNGYLRPFLEKFPAYLFAQGDLFTFHGVQFKVMRTEPAFVTEIEIPDKHSIFWKPFNGVLPKPDAETLQRAVATRLRTPSARLVLDEEWAREDRRFKSRCLTRRNQGLLCSRIGRSTRVHRGSPISIHWIDLVPQPVIDNIRTMPTRLQPFALLYAITDLGPQNISRLLDWPADDLPLHSLPSSGTGERSPAEQHQQMREHLSLKIVEEYATTYKGSDSRRHRKLKQFNTTKQQLDAGPAEDPAPQQAIEPIVCLEEQLDPTVSSDAGPEMSGETETTTCVVCLDAIRLNERILELPCSHLFHVKCVVEWLKRSILCPVCKQDLREFL